MKVKRLKFYLNIAPLCVLKSQATNSGRVQPHWQGWLSKMAAISKELPNRKASLLVPTIFALIKIYFFAFSVTYYCFLLIYDEYIFFRGKHYLLLP